MIQVDREQLRAFGRLQIDDAMLRAFIDRQATLQMSRLAALLQLIEHNGSIHGDRDDAQAAEVFYAAAKISPKVFADVVSSPAFAAWMHFVMNRALPSYSGVASGPTQTTFASYAASLALLGNIDADLHLRVGRNGAVILPSVGALLAPDSGTEGARFRCSGSAATLNCGSRQVELARNGRGVVDLANVRNCRWVPVHPVNVTGGRFELAVVLNPFEDLLGFGGVDLRAFDIDYDKWTRTTDRAWKLLVQLQPQHAIPMSRIITTFLVYHDIDETVRNSTNSIAFGAMKLTTPNDPYVLCDVFVHEFHHTKLYALTREVELFDPRDKSLYYAPWRPDPRPLTGFMHGIYSFTAVASFQASVVERAADDAVRQRAMHNFAYARAQVSLALSQLEVTRSLTPAGSAFSEGIADAMATLQKVSVGTEAQQHAEREIRVKAEEFRQHHSKLVGATT
jgi:HEXXH motif-containing protein